MSKHETHKIMKVRAATKKIVDTQHKASGLPRVEVVHRAMLLYVENGRKTAIAS